MKTPLTPQGLQELLTSLYQLPDEALQKEAATLASDLRTWLSNNFILSPSQDAYILSIDNRQIANTALAGQYFVSNRLPVYMEKEEQTEKAESEGKFFGLKTEKTSSFTPNVGYSETETLTITIAYT